MTMSVLKIRNSKDDVDSNERNVETGQDRNSEDEGTRFVVEILEENSRIMYTHLRILNSIV